MTDFSMTLRQPTLRVDRLLRCVVLLVMALVTPACANDADTPGAVWNLRQWDCKAEPGKFTLTVKWSLTVLDARGNEYAALVLNESDHVRIADVRARVMDAGGVIRELKKKDLTRACGYGNFALYDDNCQYYGDLRNPGFPYTVEIEYKLEAQSLFYWSPAVVQDDIPVTRAEYRLDIPTDVLFNYRVYGSSIEPVVTTKGNRAVYEWVFDTLPAIEDRDYVPPGYDAPIMLAFAPQRFVLGGYELQEGSWQGICDWHAKLYEECLDYSGDGRLPGEDLRTSAERIYREIIGSVRYVAIEIGIGGWQPYKASVTAERGYGDCKDMATLLVSRLIGAGIEAHPVLIRTKPGRPLDPDFPRIEFNHVIALAVIDGDSVWMDATCNTCDFGEIPWSDENVEVLVGTGAVCRTTAPAARDNRVQSDWIITVHPDDGRASIDATLSITGNYAISIRNRYPSLDADERRQFIDDWLPGANKKFKVESFEIANLYDLRKPVEIHLTAVTVKAFPRIRGTTYVSPFLCHELGDIERTDLTDRPVPLNLYYACEWSDHIVVRWDSTAAVELQSAPSSDSLNCDFASLFLAVESYQDSVVLNLDKTHLVDMVPVASFGEFAGFCDRLKDIYKGTVKLATGPRR